MAPVPSDRRSAPQLGARVAHTGLVIALVADLALIAHPRAAAGSGAVSDDDIMRMVGKHCAMCHSQNPSHTMLLGQPPPKGVILESIEDVRRLADRIFVQVVKLKIMPFGNETSMTDEERARFGAWIVGD